MRKNFTPCSPVKLAKLRYIIGNKGFGRCVAEEKQVCIFFLEGSLAEFQKFYFQDFILGEKIKDRLANLDTYELHENFNPGTNNNNTT